MKWKFVIQVRHKNEEKLIFIGYNYYPDSSEFVCNNSIDIFELLIPRNYNIQGGW